MIPRYHDHLAIVESGRVADEAIMQMAKKHTGKIFICDEEGRVVGLVSKTDYWMPQASARNSKHPDRFPGMIVHRTSWNRRNCYVLQSKMFP